MYTHCYKNKQHTAHPNNSTQCNGGVDTITFLTTVHTVMLVLTMLHS